MALAVDFLLKPVPHCSIRVVKTPRDRVAPRRGIVRPETPRDRRERAALEEDLLTIPLTGRRLPVRARFGRPMAEAYLAATRGPLPYMLRLREIEQRTGDLEASLRDTWAALADGEVDDPDRFRSEWIAYAEALSVGELNDLIDRHNRWYPVESGLPMDPRSGDYALVNGRDYRLEPLDAAWVLERFPADVSSATASAL